MLGCGEGRPGVYYWTGILDLLTRGPARPHPDGGSSTDCPGQQKNGEKVQ